MNQNYNYNQNQNYNYNQNQNYNNGSVPMNQTSFQPIQTNTSVPMNQTSFQPIQTNTSVPMNQVSYEPIQTNPLLEVHPHQLQYGNRTYDCDLCDRHFNNGKSYFCYSCNFDICESCNSKLTTKRPNTNLHSHPLKGNRMVIAWKCDVCKASFDINRFSWRCKSCNWDACIFCYFS